MDAAGVPHVAHDDAEARMTREDPGLMVSVFATFRRYLMGWDSMSRPGPVVDQFRSGLTTPQFNGVVRARFTSSPGPTVAAVRKDLAGVPWWWWVGPDSPENTASILRRHGGRELAVLPVMVRSLGHRACPGGTPGPAGPDGIHTDLRVEAVGDGERLAELVRTYRSSMGVAPALEAELVRIELQRQDNADIIRLGAIRDGQVVGSTVVITANEVAGIFLVHVTEAHRHQGVGAALTVAALQVGRERGMQAAALVASPMGEPLYRRFGFTTRAEYRLFDFPA